SVVNHPEYRPVKPKQIAKRLGLSGDAAEGVRKTVKRMVKEGVLAYGSNHLVLPVVESTGAGGGDAPARVKQSRAKHDPDHIVGTFRRMDAGFGFVRPQGTQRSEGRDADVFIPANAAGDAASG